MPAGELHHLVIAFVTLSARNTTIVVMIIWISVRRLHVTEIVVVTTRRVIVTVMKIARLTTIVVRIIKTFVKQKKSDPSLRKMAAQGYEGPLFSSDVRNRHS